MKVETKEVCSKGKSVGVAEYEVFEDLSEAVERLGEDAVVDLINAQHSTNARNKVRAGASNTMTKAALKNAAMVMITQNPDLIAEIAGDAMKLEAVLTRLSDEIKAQKEAENAPADLEEDED